MQSQLEILYKSALPLKGCRSRASKEGGFIFKKDDGSYRFFDVLEDAQKFEFLEDALL